MGEYPKIRQALNNPRNVFHDNNGRQLIPAVYRRLLKRWNGNVEVPIDNNSNRVIVVRGDMQDVTKRWADRFFNILSSFSNSVSFHSGIESEPLSTGIHIVDSGDSLMKVDDLIRFCSKFDYMLSEKFGSEIKARQPIYLVRDEIMHGRREHKSFFERFPDPKIIANMIIDIDTDYPPPLWRMEKFEFYEKSC